MGIAAMAAMTLVSCSSDDLNSLSDNSSKNEAISFDSYLGRSAVAVNGSRGSVIDKAEDLQKVSEGFGVFGNYKENDGLEFGSNLFDNVQVTYSSSTEPAKWKYDNTKYWPTEGHIDFLAYAPYKEGKTLTNTSCIDFTVESEAANQKDLLWANAKDQTKAKNSGENKVKFTFKHALAKIGYSVKSNADYDHTTITIKSIKLVGSEDENTNAFYTNGTIDLSKADNKANDLWKTTSDDTKQNFTLPSSNLTLSTTKHEPTDYLFVIPQNFSGTANKLYVVEYTVKTGNTVELMNKVSKQITMNFLQGKAYMINLTIGLTPIEFEATVDSWTNGEDIGGFEWN